ncbi:MAG: dihydropteroate synthase, partial [Acidimicrobiia bacterium]|nr:dihydropteroate synthase [Acidimicrobiia bacterium]
MPSFRLGPDLHDLRSRVLVMGILNRTPDSFYDRGATYGLDALLRRADRIVSEGADILDVGGVKAGPGPDVGEAEELD